MRLTYSLRQIVAIKRSTAKPLFDTHPQNCNCKPRICRRCSDSSSLCSVHNWDRRCYRCSRCSGHRDRSSTINPDRSNIDLTSRCNCRLKGKKIARANALLLSQVFKSFTLPLWTGPNLHLIIQNAKALLICIINADQKNRKKANKDHHRLLARQKKTSAAK